MIVAIAEGRFIDASAIATQTGRVSLAAEIGIAAAVALLEAGRGDEAVLHLEHALEFYRSVGATRYIREAEELLTVTNAAGEQQPI
jgi:hypothetical protein